MQGSIEMPDGPKTLTPRKKINRCHFCKKRLSIYNENKYCFVHVMAGFKMELEIERERKHKLHLAHLVKMKQRLKRKKREKEMAGGRG